VQELVKVYCGDTALLFNPSHWAWASLRLRSLIVLVVTAVVVPDPLVLVVEVHSQLYSLAQETASREISISENKTHFFIVLKRQLSIRYTFCL